MEQLPDFWRTEIWHPLTVHFPVALLSFATIFIIAGYWTKRSNFLFTGKALLIAGTLGAWVAVYTGSLADAVVTRHLCDPTILEDHENGAFTVAWLFSAASALIVTEHFKLVKKFQQILRTVIIALIISGTGFLVYTGHLGATLVYQQAAGVYTPSEDCIEFTEPDS